MGTNRRSSKFPHGASELHTDHSKARCLRVLRHLSSFLDNELPHEVCNEIRKHLGNCPNCEDFIHSLRQTVSLCRHATYRPMSPALRARIRTQVLKAVGQG